MTSLHYKIISLAGLVAVAGCSSGFLGLAPMGDRKEYIQARTAYEAGNYQTAVTLLTDYIYKAKNIKRREARAYRLLGKSYEQLNQPNRALETFLEALEFHPDNVPLLVEAARLYQQNGLTERSIELYARALSEEPQNSQALAGQAANYAALGFYSKARTLYDELFQLSEQISPYYQALYANTFLRQRNYKQAFIHITQALTQDDQNADFWLLSAQARRGLKMPQAALADLQAAISLAPQRTDLQAYKALWLYEAADYDAAWQTAQKILEQNPDSALAQFIKALCLQKQGKTGQARQLLEQIAHQEQASFISQVAAKLTSRLEQIQPGSKQK